MASITYYAALPFVRNEEGELCPDEAVECTSSTAAVVRARALGATKAGAIAFPGPATLSSANGPTPSSCCRSGTCRRILRR